MKNLLILFVCSVVLVAGCKHKSTEDGDKTHFVERVEGDGFQSEGS